MPVITFSKTSDEASANILLTKFYERLQIESNGTAISVLEFIAQVKSNSTFNFSKLDIVIPYVVSKIEDVTDTFTDKNLVTNQLYTNGFEVRVSPRFVRKYTLRKLHHTNNIIPFNRDDMLK